MSIRPTLRNVLLFMALAVCGSLISSNTTYAGPLTPNYKYQGKDTIAVSGGFLTSQEDDNAPIFLDGKMIRSNEPSDSYNASKGELYFKKTSKADLFYTGFNSYFELTGLGINKNTNQKCYVGIKVDPGSTSGKYVGLIKDGKSYKEDGGCTDNVSYSIANTNIFDSSILGTIAKPQESTDAAGNNIPTCKSSDAACLTKRNKAIDAYETANRCYTGSTSDLSNCKYNSEVVACLRSDPGLTYKHCVDTQEARGILDGEFTGITAETTDEDITKICNLLSISEREACKQKATEYRDTLTDGGENVTACNIGGLGWVICPFVRFLAGITDAAYEYITEMLAVPTSVLFVQDENAAGSLYKPWSIMRNIANVAFVIAFMVIIYSQITSMGVSNYGIKKMLPRLIISALLVNSSFWIAGIAVELSNVAGESLYSLLGGTDLYSAAAAQTPKQADWVTLSDRAVMGLTVGGAVGSGLLTSSILIPILLGSALAIMIAVFVLTLRQAFIIGLIIIAPLAFVAFLLPNTEEWFKRWWKVFRTLLLLFPIIALIFGASSVASQVLTAVAATYTQPILKFVMEVMAAGVQILPLFLTTILTNVTQGTLGKLTGLVNNKNKGLIDRSKNFARDRQKYRNEATKAGYGRFGKRKSNWNPMKRAGGFGRAMDKVNRTQKTDMERFDNELETDWRSSGGGGRAIQSQMSSSQALGKVKVDAEVRSINNPNNTTLQADVEASNLSLSKAKAALETKNLTNPDLKQSRADVAASEARLSAAKTSVDADHSELAAGQNIGGYAPGTEIGMEQATDAGVYQGIRKDSAGRIANTERAERIKNSQAIQDLAGGIDPRGADRVKAYAADTQSRAEDEAVGQTISTLKSENSHEQIDKAAALLEKSLNENDEIGARAATRFLDQSAGSPGKSKLRETMEKVQNSPQGFQHPNVVQAVKAEGKSGPSTKAYDVVMDTFYNGDDSVKISTLKNTSAQIDRLKESEIVGQDKAQLRHWAANNIMSRARAQQVLDANKDHNLPIEEEKLKIFKLMASSSNPTP